MVNKAKMLSAGVADVVLKFLRSEMPPVQFKLLGTLRMLIDTQGQRGVCLKGHVGTGQVRWSNWSWMMKRQMMSVSMLGGSELSYWVCGPD